MSFTEDWNEIAEWLSGQRSIELSKGGKFKARYIGEVNSIEIVPIKTGIPRRINENQWDIFIEKFKEVKRSGYDPYRPGHYAHISHNASYLVAILQKFDDTG